MLPRHTIFNLLSLSTAYVHATDYYALHGAKWPPETCNGLYPANEPAIAQHTESHENCPNDNLIVVNEPGNNPQIRHHDVNGEPKMVFYDDNNTAIIHIAECFSAFGLPAPKIEAVVTLKNGTILAQEFNIAVCLGKTSGNFLSINADSEQSLFPDLDLTAVENNFNKNCPTDFYYLNDEESDWLQKSTGIWFHTLDKSFDQAEIKCRSTHFKNFTAGVPESDVTESAAISIRVSHPMERVELEVEQNSRTGVVTELSCRGIGGYPQTSQIKYIVNDATMTAEEILGQVLPSGAKLQCIGTWHCAINNKSKEMESKIYTSTFVSDGPGIIVKGGGLTTGSEEEEGKSISSGSSILVLVLAVLATFVVFAIIFVVYRRKRKQENEEDKNEEDPLKDTGDEEPEKA